MTQPWRPETGISREKYNKWVEGLHDQNYRGSIAHPSVTLPGPAVTEPTIPGLGPGYGSTPTGQINPLPPIPSQAPRPEGFQRAITGLADYVTGNKFDFDQRGRGGSNRWEEQIGRGTGGGDPREAMRQWNAPNDLTVSQGAEQGVRRGGGILDRIKGFLGGLEVMPNELVDDPRNPGGPQIHPDLLDNQWRDRYEKGIQQWNR